MHPVFHSSQTCPRCCEHCSTAVREISQYFSVHQISTELMQFKQPNQILKGTETSWLTGKPCLQSRGYKNGGWWFLYLSIFSRYCWKNKGSADASSNFIHWVFSPKTLNHSSQVHLRKSHSINVLQSNSFSFSPGRKKVSASVYYRNTPLQHKEM